MGPRSWSHSIEELADRIERLAPDASLRLVRGTEVAARWDPSRKSILCIRRRAPREASTAAFARVADGSGPPPAGPAQPPQRNAGITSWPKSSSARSS